MRRNQDNKSRDRKWRGNNNTGVGISKQGRAKNFKPKGIVK